MLRFIDGMSRGLFFLLAPALLGLYVPMCAPVVRPTASLPGMPRATLWERPGNLATRDLFNGEWGARLAPDPRALYSRVSHRDSGVTREMAVLDPEGRKWSVKQEALGVRSPEKSIEVAVSRLLAAVGYHQPPVYYLPAFTLKDERGTHVVPGGRFRLYDTRLKERGDWSWQQNPFVGTRPYQGLLVMLVLLNSADLGNGDNALYEYRAGERVELRYVVRDLGSALGETGRIAPLHGDPEAFARQPFILGVTGGFVGFHYHGRHQELLRARITPDDVGWACERLASLSDRQWRDAFGAGGYPRETADRFIRAIQARVRQGLDVAARPVAQR